MREKRWPQRESLGTPIFTKYGENEEIAKSLKALNPIAFLPNSHFT